MSLEAHRVGQLGCGLGLPQPYWCVKPIAWLVADGRLVPLATPALFIEYEDVLKRPEQREVSGLSLAEVDTALTALASLLEPVEVRFTWRPQLADPGDEMVLDAAVNGLPMPW